MFLLECLFSVGNNLSPNKKVILWGAYTCWTQCSLITYRCLDHESLELVIGVSYALLTIPSSIPHNMEYTHSIWVFVRHWANLSPGVSFLKLQRFGSGGEGGLSKLESLSYMKQFQSLFWTVTLSFCMVTFTHPYVVSFPPHSHVSYCSLWSACS